MADLGFDVGNTPAETPFEPMPPGYYAMRIVEADIAHSEKAGPMLKVTFEIDEHQHPDFAGRKVWGNFCHQHENEKTRSIARSQIAAIFQAIGKPNASDSNDMLGGELLVKLSVKPADGTYSARNETKGFKALGSSTDEPVAAPAAAAPSKKQPWKR